MRDKFDRKPDITDHRESESLKVWRGRPPDGMTLPDVTSAAGFRIQEFPPGMTGASPVRTRGASFADRSDGVCSPASRRYHAHESSAGIIAGSECITHRRGSPRNSS